MNVNGQAQQPIDAAQNSGPEIGSINPLFSKTLKSPLYEAEFPSAPPDAAKLDAVKEAFLHAFRSYAKYCWGHDELCPLTRRCKDTLNAGLTIVDSLTTLYIMNCSADYERAREFIERDFRPNGSWSLFEFIIRFVGGFISIYQLTNDRLYLTKAKECADAIFPLFDMKTGFYSSKFKITTDKNGTMKASGNRRDFLLAEVGTYQIEFLTLTALTGDQKYLNLALKVYRTIWSKNTDKAIIGTPDGHYSDSIHLGAGRDSYFEYIIKTYILTGGTSKRILQQHNQMMKEIREKLLFKTKNLKLAGVGILSRNHLIPKMEHLATFVPGMIAIGTVKGNKHIKSDMEIAANLVGTFAHVTRAMKSKLMAEKMDYNTDKENEPDFKLSNDRYMLRPETVESIFYLWRFTGDQKYRDMAWDFFLGINTSCRVQNGFVTVTGLDSKEVKHIDIMESFFLAETLNYLYLSFADNRLISPTDWVFNTESHPLHVWPPDIVEKYKKQLSLDDIPPFGGKR